MRRESFSLNPYGVLGVPSNASTAEIQAAYRQRALRWHPDRNADDEYSLRMMQRVNAAWAILKDEQSRSAYDRWERGESRSASGPQAWRRPRAGSSPGREWYRPPPSSATEDRASRYDASVSSKTGELAGFWIRFIAFVVDALTIIAIALLVASVLEIPISERSTPDGWNYAAILLIAWVLAIVYSTILVGAWRTTLGKQFFGLRVVRTDGSKIGICRAFSRALFFFTFFSPIILVISSVMIALQQSKRGLHDLVCDTEVVYR